MPAWLRADMQTQPRLSNLLAWAAVGDLREWKKEHDSDVDVTVSTALPGRSVFPPHDGVRAIQG